MDLERIGAVLVRGPNWLGDAVMAIPALRQLRRLFANGRLTIVCRRPIAGLYEDEGLADEIFLTDGSSLSALIRETLALRKFSRWDLAVLLQNAMSGALLARAAGARRVAGYPTDGRRILLRPVIPLDPEHKKRHQVHYYLEIAGYLERMLKGPADPDPQAITPDLHASGRDRALAAELLSNERVLAPEMAAAVAAESSVGLPNSFTPPIVALNPGATNSRAKRWDPSRFAAVADRLAQQFGSRTIIVGAEGDRDTATAVALAMKSPAAVLAGKTGISALKGVLSYSSLVVSNDTGTAHLAAALQIPTVVVFGPTEDFATKPLSPSAEVVRHPVDCSPCMLRDCPIDHRCMTGVTVQQVYEVACRKLDDSSAGQA
ncbi:MAG TPA: lipopolysaccharide heptosyltransferase II [Blastocatellia bacterium]|nr:lipopolysaccharide heptosyltransferase II [Blastocatellia bacterium]